MDFSANTSLESIRLDFFDMGRPRSARSGPTDAQLYLCDKLAGILERFRSSSHLDELIVDIYRTSIIRKPSNINPLVAVLRAAPFSRMRKLQFNGAWGMDSDKDAEVSRKVFTRHVIDKLPVSSSCTVLLFDSGRR